MVMMCWCPFGRDFTPFIVIMPCHPYDACDDDVDLERVVFGGEALF